MAQASTEAAKEEPEEDEGMAEATTKDEKGRSARTELADKGKAELADEGTVVVHGKTNREIGENPVVMEDQTTEGDSKIAGITDIVHKSEDETDAALQPVPASVTAIVS